MVVQISNPFNLLVVEEQQEAKRQILEKKDKQSKPKPRRRRCGQNQDKPPNADDLVSSVSSVTISSDIVHQINESKVEEVVVEACDDNEGWKLVKFPTRNRNGYMSRSHSPQIEKKQLAVVNNHVVVVEDVVKQLMEAATGFKGSEKAKARKPNMNGSARRRLQKKTVPAPVAAKTAPSENSEKKLVVTYTLKEFEERNKNGDEIKSEEKHVENAGEKERKGFNGSRQKQKKGGNYKRFNSDVEDVSCVALEKSEDVSFTLDANEFPSLGKAL